MPKSSECVGEASRNENRCQRFSGYLGEEYLVYAVHPSGPAKIPCPNFADEPLRAEHYGGELVIMSEHYLNREDCLEILNTYPLFTGKCPEFDALIPYGDRVHIPLT
ncbi:MAG: hypothetical protein AAF215_32760 [Cyanobacteria bacterium P01_A01_bin.123]